MIKCKVMPIARRNSSMIHKRHIVLFGGGLDSTAVLLYLYNTLPVTEFNVELVHVNYGQKAAEAEIESMVYFADKYQAEMKMLTMSMSYSTARIMKGTEIGKEKNSNRLELRNPALLSFVASYAASSYERSVLYVGFHLEPDGCFPDATVRYLNALELALNLATNRYIEIYAPLSDMTRFEILREAAATDSAVITKTHTCYEKVACGKCTHCVEKEAMVQKLLKANLHASEKVR